MPTYTTSQELDPLLPFIFLFPSAVFNGLFFTFIAYSHVVRFLRNRQETSTLTSVRARVPSPFIVYLHLRSLHQCLTLFSFFFFLAPVRATVTGTVTFGASLTYRSYSPAFPFFFPQKPQQSVFFLFPLAVVPTYSNTSSVIYTIRACRGTEKRPSCTSIQSNNSEARWRQSPRKSCSR